jgi:small conductance mechanosensitive channel
VEALGESQVTLRLLLKTVPSKQWDVARELRRRIKNRFDREKIAIPYPHRVVVTRTE